MTEEPRACPSCAAANRPTRELCARCGAGLDDGVVPPRPIRREAPDPPVVEPAPRRHDRWLVPLAGAVALIGIVVLGLTLFGLGPLATPPEVPAATFDPGRYDGDPSALPLASVATRTTAADAQAAAAIADADPQTAWRSAGTASADGEILDTIDLILDGPAWVERIEVLNGDHGDRESYDRAARMREVRLRFDGGVVLLADLLDLGTRAQAVTLPEPVLTSVVRIEILRAVEAPSEQIAVSGIDLVGWAAAGEDVELAADRAAAEPATGATAGPTGLGLGR